VLISSTASKASPFFSFLIFKLTSSMSAGFLNFKLRNYKKIKNKK